jgi:hypothetical protein
MKLAIAGNGGVVVGPQVAVTGGASALTASGRPIAPISLALSQSGSVAAYGVTRHVTG